MNTRYRPITAAALILLACLITPPARAWNHTGHRVSALIAWQEMTLAAREAASAVLKAHPRYEQDLLRDRPGDFAEPERWAFMTAAYWSDIIRDRSNPMHRTYHKAQWHYVNFAYAPDGDRRGFQDGERATGDKPQQPPSWTGFSETPHTGFNAYPAVATAPPASVPPGTHRGSAQVHRDGRLR